MVGLRFCWAVLGAPTGKRLAPVMGELVATLRRFGELDVCDELAGQRRPAQPRRSPTGPIDGPPPGTGHLT